MVLWFNNDSGRISWKRNQVQFITADCGQGAHTGLAYIDNIVNERKCDKPQYGYINLDHNEYECSPKQVNVCGTFIAPQNSVIDEGALELEFLQNGELVSVPASAITLTSLIDETFCFNVNFETISMDIALYGSYEFRVKAKFISTINGYAYHLLDESIREGADISFSGTGVPLDTYIDFNNDTITWPAVGGPYYLEFYGDGDCCPRKSTAEPEPRGGSLVTYDTTISFGECLSTVDLKCVRFRIRTECVPWTQWCCITSHFPENAGYEITEEGKSFDCINVLDLQGKQTQEVYVYPNATKGSITIKNSASFKFELYDYSNNLVLSKEILPAIQEQVVLDLSHLKQGIYILKTDKGQSIKVVKN